MYYKLYTIPHILYYQNNIAIIYFFGIFKLYNISLHSCCIYILSALSKSVVGVVSMSQSTPPTLHHSFCRVIFSSRLEKHCRSICVSRFQAEKRQTVCSPPYPDTHWLPQARLLKRTLLIGRRLNFAFALTFGMKIFCGSESQGHSYSTKLHCSVQCFRNHHPRIVISALL